MKPPQSPPTGHLAPQRGDFIIYDSDAEGAGHQGQRVGEQHHRRGSDASPTSRPSKPKPWYTARSILGAFSIMLSLAMLGMGIKLLVKYDGAPLIHVSVAFVIFTAVASITWTLFEFIAICARRQRRGIYPGAHVGVHMCLCLACVAAVGYASIWVSHYGRQARYKQQQQFEFALEGGQPLPAATLESYHPIYNMGIVIVILSSLSLTVHFILSILACQEIRRKDDNNTVRTVVTIRYDGVGPTGTARPISYYHHQDARHSDSENGGISLPVYTARDPEGNVVRSQPPVVIARGDLGVEIRPDELREYDEEEEEETKEKRSSSRSRSREKGSCC